MVATVFNLLFTLNDFQNNATTRRAAAPLLRYIGWATCSLPTNELKSQIVLFTDSGGGSKLSWMADRLILYTHMYIVVNCVILSEFLTRIIKSTTNVMCTFAAAWGHLYVFLLLQWPEMTALHTPVSAQNLGAPPPSCSSWSFTVRSLEEGSHQVHTCYLLTTSHSNVLCAYACPQTHHMHAQTCAHTYTQRHMPHMCTDMCTHSHRHTHTCTHAHVHTHAHSII